MNITGNVKRSVFGIFFFITEQDRCEGAADGRRSSDSKQTLISCQLSLINKQKTFNTCSGYFSFLISVLITFAYFKTNNLQNFNKLLIF